MERKETEELFAQLRAGAGPQEWGWYTVVKIRATNPDKDGNYQVGLVEEGEGEPVWEPVQCNRNGDPDEELDDLISQVYDLCKQVLPHADDE